MSASISEFCCFDHVAIVDGSAIDVLRLEEAVTATQGATDAADRQNDVVEDEDDDLFTAVMGD